MTREDDSLDPKIERILPYLKEAPPEGLPSDFTDRVLAEAGERSPGSGPSLEGALRRILDAVKGLLAPRPAVIRPAWQLGWAMVLCVMSSAATFLAQDAVRSEGDPNILVRFTVQAPDARTVSLAGDFNGWATEDIRLEDLDGDGVWQAVVPLNPGVYQYMFVVNGAEWISDPTSPGRIADGFGRTNSLLRITDATLKTQRERRHAS